MTIRPAVVADVPRVLPLVKQINELHQAWDRHRFSLRADFLQSYDSWLRQRCDDPNSVFLVLAADDAIVGYLVGTIEDEIPIYWMPRCGWIHDLWVEEAYRHEGHGRQMAMLAVEKFAALGVGQIRLQTAAANESARNLFASCGFRVCTIEMMLPLGDNAARGSAGAQ